jgi:benzoate/toluate 1,2-dioxygenase beta subunit
VSVIQHRTGVRDEYDALAYELELIWERGPAHGDALQAAVSAQLHAEARLLDGRCFEQWLELWASEASFWVPLNPAAHPARDQSLILDDRRRLAERVAWMRDPAAWGVQPAPVTIRVVGGVEAWSEGDEVVSASTILLHSERAGAGVPLAGRQLHRWVRGDRGQLLIRRKILILPRLLSAVGNRGYLL